LWGAWIAGAGCAPLPEAFLAVLDYHLDGFSGWSWSLFHLEGF
jgi:hypothetical protein